MSARRKLSAWTWAILASSMVVLSCFFFLSRPSRCLDLRALDDRPVVSSGILTAARRGDVIEPYEYFEYTWRQPFKDARQELHAELTLRGFRISDQSKTFVAWQKDDIEVWLYSGRGIREPREGEQSAIIQPETDWSCLFLWRLLDNGILTQLRTWLYDQRKNASK